MARGHVGTTTLGYGHLASCHVASCHLDKTVKYDILAPFELNINNITNACFIVWHGNVLHKPDDVTSITSSCYTNVPNVQVRHTITSSFVIDCFVLEPYQSRGWPAPIECCKRCHAEILVVSSPLKPYLCAVCANATEAACSRRCLFLGDWCIHRTCCWF